MNKNKITPFELTTLTFFLFNSFLFTTGIQRLAKQNNTDSVLSILIGFLFLLLFFQLIKGIYQFHQKQDILGKIEILFPKTKLLIFFLLIIILFTQLIYSIHQISTFINYYILKETKLIIITVTLLLTVLYICKKGIISIVKLSEICFYLYLFLFIMTIIGTLKYLNLENIKPLLTSTIEDNTKSSLLYFSSLIIPFFLIAMLPKEELSQKKKYEQAIAKGIRYSSLICFLELLITISILGIQLTKIYLYPEMIVYKKISFLNILEHLETTLAFSQILNSLFIIVFSLWSLHEIIKKVIPLKKEKENISYSLLILLLIFAGTLLTIPHRYFLIENIVILTLLVFIRVKIHYSQTYPAASN
ncbi:MAG TPA: GerAB/ArcD/ProY family transporter [Candidatus Scybalousia intestinigallinarum]|nr:GerAB/ArcD/ProY family transporter [Candidatus Scybalousia intestinigallinarum]